MCTTDCGDFVVKTRWKRYSYAVRTLVAPSTTPTSHLVLPSLRINPVYSGTTHIVKLRAISHLKSVHYLPIFRRLSFVTLSLETKTSLML